MKKRAIPASKKNKKNKGMVRKKTTGTVKKEKVTRNEALLLSILENTDGAVWMLDRKKHLIAFNKKFVESYKAVSGKVPVAGSGVFEFLPEDQQKKRSKNLDRVFKGERVVFEPAHMINGSRHYFRTSLNPIVTNGKVTGVSCYSIEITGSKKTENKIKESEEKYRSLFDQATDPIMITDFDGNFMDVNAALCSMFGYARRELLSMNIRALIDPEQLKVKPISFERLAKGGHFFNERQMIKKDGTIVYVEANVKKIDDRHVLAIARNITDKKKAELLIQKSEASLRSIFNITDTGYLLFDTRLHIITLNAVAVERSKLLFGKIMKPGDAFMDFMPAHRKEKVRATFDKVLSGETEEYEIDYQATDGNLLWLLIKMYPILGENREILGVCLSTRDITRQKKIETDLREAELKFRSLVEKSLAGVYIIQDNRFSYVNPMFAQIFGYEEHELLDTFPVGMVVSEEDRAAVMEMIRARLENEVESFHYEARGLKKDGHMIWMEVFGNRTVYNGKTAIIGTLIDITDRKKFEINLTESEKRYRALVENAVEALVVFDIQANKFVSVSESACRLFKTTEAELLKIGPAELSPLRQPDGRLSVDGIFETIDMAIKGGKPAFEWVHCDIHGTPISCEVRLVHLPSADSILIRGSILDITERKKTEKEIKDKSEQLRRLSDHLQQVREEERKNIAREIHDELGQLLTGIKMDASWLSKKFDSSQADLSNRVEEMLQLTDRTIESVRKIATELRPGILDDLGLEEAILWQANEFQNKSGITCKVEGTLRNRTCSPELSIAAFRILQESLTNIIRHAEAKHVVIKMKTTDATLMLEILDDGNGMLQESLDEKRTLGIMGMKERASMMGGLLIINSIPLKGTTVKIELPLTNPQ